MRLAVISDLHIGPKGTDLLYHDDSSFLSFLRNLEMSYDKIILLGDVIETLMPKRPGQFEQTFKEAWDYRKDITRRFETDKYTYIFGNHDWIAGKLVGAIEKLRISYNDRSFLFMHGHQTDKLYNRSVGEPVMFAVGWGIRMGLGPLYRHIARIETARHCRNVFFKQEVEDIAKDENVNTIIMGHTHTSSVRNFDNTTYMNSGHCAFGNREFLSMDLDNDKFSTETW